MSERVRDEVVSSTYEVSDARLHAHGLGRWRLNRQRHPLHSEQRREIGAGLVGWGAENFWSTWHVGTSVLAVAKNDGYERA